MADSDSNSLTIKNNSTRGFASHPENINRNGRPPKECVISDKLLDMIKEKPELLNAIAGTLFELAVKNKDLAAIKEITDRVEGKAIQRQELSGPDGKDLPIPIISIANVSGNISNHQDKTTD